MDSSHRAQAWRAKPTDPYLPTRDALDLHGKQVRREANRRARLAARGHRP